MNAQILYLLLSTLIALTGGCDRPGRWSFELENHSGERFSDVSIACDGKSWPLPGAGGVAMGLNGDMPKALDVSFSDEDGGRHKVHVNVPPIPRRGSAIPHVYILIEGRDKVTAHAIDPEDAPRSDTPAELAAAAKREAASEKNKIAYTILNRTDEKLLDIALHFEGENPGSKGYPVGTMASGDSSGLTMSPPKEIKSVDVAFTTPDGAPHRVHMVIPPTQRGGPETPHVYLLIEGRDKVTASTTQP